MIFFGAFGTQWCTGRLHPRTCGTLEPIATGKTVHSRVTGPPAREGNAGGGGSSSRVDEKTDLEMS
jgi:hypothetical protein